MVHLSGAMSASERNRSEPLFAGSAAAALRTLRGLAAAHGLDQDGALSRIDARTLLTERAALHDWNWPTDVSCAGTCRLLNTSDRPLAVNLPRASDRELLPPWLEADDAEEWGWPEIEARLGARTCAEWIARGREIGLAVAPADPPPAEPVPPWRAVFRGRAAGDRALGRRAPRILDLSALWAGPLCAHLLERCGASVIKVESIKRPDGSRFGNALFYGLLNQHKLSIALDLDSAGGVERLHRLIAGADIVIESSRPRALRHFGVHAEQLVARQAGLTWVSITGYGRAEPRSDWIAFGDDAAVAAGTAELMKQATGKHAFAGDAIADPLTGLYAALAALRSWQAGGGELLELSLCGVVQHCIRREMESGASDLLGRFAAWRSAYAGHRVEVFGAPRTIDGRVARLGEDNERVFAREEAAC